MSSDSWVSKFPLFFRSKEMPQVMILGSSLPMAGFSITNVELMNIDNDEERNEQLRTTLKCELFSDLLLKQLEQSKSHNCAAKVANLCCAGCMISDVYHLIQACINNGLLPKVIFLGIAPRDFSDNWIPPIGQTPLWQAVDQWSVGNVVWSSTKPMNEKLLAIGKEFSEFLRLRKDLKEFLALMFESVVKNPGNFVAQWCSSMNGTGIASRETAKVKPQDSSFEKDLVAYSARYRPVNQQRLIGECDNLQKLVSVCYSKQIKLIIIDMPLTVENRALIPKPTSEIYQHLLGELSKDRRIKLIECNRSKIFSAADFSDSAHLNREGAAKFQNMVANLLTPEDLVSLCPQLKGDSCVK